uniref:ARID DNA-binding domain-containing protein n=1 Tax=Tanacetum cinerariifolium TaxID=118510 RepID=A0A6L2KV26_TANCI|nr:ARID DNA-binding domain-containing protein [Tanacetum cinerariifolium]
MGHIVKFCPMDNKDEDMVMKTDTRNLAKERKEGFKTTKPTIMLKYPESIHFSTTCMIKGTDHANWDDIWFNKVVKWFYNHYLERSLPRPIPPTINGVQVYLFDLYKLTEGLGGYLSVYFCQEFDTIGEIMGLSRGNGEEIKKCYMNYLDVFTSYFKTARAPPQGNRNILDESTRNVEDKDRDYLMSHQWDFGETGAPIRKIAVPKGKETLEHFGVKLEDTRDSQDQPILTHSTRNQNLQGILPRPVTSDLEIQAAAKVMISPSSLKDSQDLKAYDLREENVGK